MKKLVLALLVVALAIPAMAADISLTDNGDGTGDIVLTVTGIEVVRGLAIVVDAGTDIVGVSGTDAIFNVYMDAAFSAGAGYALGDGTPVADPAAAGEIALGAGVSVVSLCMGVLDELGTQGGAAAGSYVVGVIDIAAAGTVTITADTLRGGIVGDDLDAATIAGGDIGFGPGDCIALGHPDRADWDLLGQPGSWCNPRQCYGDADALQETYGKITPWVGLNDLDVLVQGWRKLYVGGETWIAADFDRREEAYGKIFPRVGLNDLSILVANWRKDASVTPTNCND